MRPRSISAASPTACDSRPLSPLPRRRSRNPRASYLEALEARTLLSASFSTGDFAGQWAVVGLYVAGSLTADGSGHFTAGTFRDTANTPQLLDLANSSYTLGSAGDLDVDVQAGSFFAETWGYMNSSKDVALLTSSQTDDTPVLIKHTLNTFSDADFVGTWSFNTFTPEGYPARGTLTADSQNTLTGSATDTNGSRVSLTGTYGVNPDGSLTIDVVAGGDSFHYTGAMNDGRTFAGVNASPFVSSSNATSPSAIFLEKSAAGFSNASLYGNYFVTLAFNDADYDIGGLYFDGAGHINPDESDLYGISGTYTVTPTGQVTINAKFQDYGQTGTGKFTGALTSDGDIATLSGVERWPGWGDTYQDLMIMTSSNATPRLSAVTPFATAIGGSAYAFTYNDLLAHSNAQDADGDPIHFEIYGIGNGQLLLNGKTAGLWDDIGPNDTLSWTPAANANGTLTAFTIMANDGDEWANSIVPVKFVTVPKPVITVAATKPAASETHTALTGLGKFTLTRTGGDLTQPLTVHFDMGGEATLDTDYHLDSSANSYTFVAGQKTATVTLTPDDDAAAEGTEAATLALADGDDYIAAAGKRSATVSIADNEPVVGVVATKPNALEAATPVAGVFTLTRSGGDLTQPLTVAFAVGGTVEGADFTCDANGTVTFRAGQKTATVTVTPIDDAIPDYSDTFDLILVSGGNCVLAPGKGKATVYIRDTEPVISVSAAKTKLAESATPVGVPVTFTRKGDVSQPLTVAFWTAGNANATDYHTNAVNSRVTFAAGQKTATVLVTPDDDTLAEGTESLVIAVSDTNVYSADPSKYYASLTIADNEPVVGVVATKAKAGETGATGLYTFTRTGGNLAEQLIVQFSMSGAPEGVDYTLSSSQSVLFAPRQTTATVKLTPNDDYTLQATQAAILTLTPDASYAIDAARGSATVTIADHNRPLTTGPASVTVGPIHSDALDFDALLTTLQISDPEDAAITLKVKVILPNSTLLVNGHIASVGTVISAGDQIQWLPPNLHMSGVYSAFSVTASDGVNTSTVKAVKVSYT